MILLSRFSSTKNGVFGALIKDYPLCWTLEDPDNQNKQRESCIPPGKYSVVKHSGPRFKNVWRLDNVPGRSAILIHSGNTINDTLGCILVGNSIHSGGIGRSLEALNMLREVLPEKFILEIKNQW